MNHLLPYIKKTLESHFPPAELKSLTKIICCDLLEIGELDFYVRKDIHLSENKQKELETILHRLINHEPIQYIVGHTPFCGHSFEVNQHVLIPRPETEELVELIAKENPKAKLIFDMGTGSGCIAISLSKKLPNCEVRACDISAEALKVARRNNKRLGASVCFEKQNILKYKFPANLEEMLNLDVIVSNPPYITESEKAGMDPNVLEWEPATALFVPDDDPLLFYSCIAELGFFLLSSEGKLYFEVNQAYGKEVCEMLNDMGYSRVRLIKDMFNNKRFVKACI